MNKNKIRIKLLSALAVTAFSLLSIELFGQPGTPGGGSEPDCWDTDCVPIDGGIGFLLAAAIAYGGKRAYDASQIKKKDDNNDL